jgi:hypothetical protein
MSGFGILGTTKPSVDDIADVLEAGAGTADLTRVQSSVSGDLNQLYNWFRGDIKGKTIVLSGDSTTADTSSGFVTRLQYLGATVRRPIPGTVTVSRSGNVVTMSGASNFLPADVGGTIYWSTGQSSAIIGYTSGTVITVADSGTIAASNGYILRAGSVNENTPLAGVTVYHCGDNGQSAQGHIVGTGVFPLSYIVSLQADLYVSSFLINDVRLGGTDLATATSRLQTIYDALAAAKAGTCVMMRIPNTLLSTDPGGTGFVSPLTSAQAYSDLMAAAYRSLYSSRPTAYIWDTRKTIWDGDACKTTTPLMGDILHPSGLGQSAAADDFARLVGMPFGYQRSQSDAAFSASPTTPWTVYPAILEDQRYFRLITTGKVNSSGAGYIIIDPQNKAESQNSLAGDVIWQDGSTPFVQSGSGTNVSGAAGYMQIGMTSPVSLTAKNRIRVFRQLGLGDAEILVRLGSPDQFPFSVPVTVAAAGNGFVYINPTLSTDTRLNDIQASDNLVIQGVTPLVLTGATFGSQFADGSGYITVIQTGDKSAMSGKKGYLFGSARSAFRTSGVPIVPRDGQIWYDSAAGAFKCRIGGVTKTFTVV